jgi:hypothetical protein
MTRRTATATRLAIASLLNQFVAAASSIVAPVPAPAVVRHVTDSRVRIARRRG